MASYKVVVTKDAEADLENIHNYISEHDCPENTDYVLDELLAVADNLTNFPMKGTMPNELQTLGIREFRQILFKPYRVIYRVLGQQIIIYVITDGRRDMKALLSRRLLG